MAIRKILRLPGVEHVTGFKKSKIYDLIGQGEFPRPVQLSSQAVGWYEDEIEVWQQKLDRATGGWCPRDRKRRSTSESSA